MGHLPPDRRRGAKRTDVTVATPPTEKVVDDLPVERENLLVSYCEMLALDFDELSRLGEVLRDFGQRLTDYSALSQFGLVDSLLQRRQDPMGDSDALLATVKRLRELTEQYLEFVERYRTNGHSADLRALCQDIERIGLSLAEQFEIEDGLIQSLAAR